MFLNYLVFLHRQTQFQLISNGRKEESDTRNQDKRYRPGYKKMNNWHTKKAYWTY
jgi:hypothetical protein